MTEVSSLAVLEAGSSTSRCHQGRFLPRRCAWWLSPPGILPWSFLSAQGPLVSPSLSQSLLIRDSILDSGSREGPHFNITDPQSPCLQMQPHSEVLEVGTSTWDSEGRSHQLEQIPPPHPPRLSNRGPHRFPFPTMSASVFLGEEPLVEFMGFVS